VEGIGASLDRRCERAGGGGVPSENPPGIPQGSTWPPHWRTSYRASCRQNCLPCNPLLGCISHHRRGNCRAANSCVCPCPPMHPAFNIDLRLELHIKLDFASKFIDPESIKSSQRFLRGTLPPPSLGSAIARVFQLHGFQKGTHGAEWGLNPVLFCVCSEGQGRGGVHILQPIYSIPFSAALQRLLLRILTAR